MPVHCINEFDFALRPSSPNGPTTLFWLNMLGGRRPFRPKVNQTDIWQNMVNQ